MKHAENTLSNAQQGEIARALYADLVSGESDRASAAQELRKIIAAREDGVILALRSERENAVKDNRAADVWIRAMLAGAVRGKEYASLPRLTVKKTKGALRGVSFYSVVEKDAPEEIDETIAQQEEIEKAIATIRCALQNGIAFNAQNFQNLNIMVQDEVPSMVPQDAE